MTSCKIGNSSMKRKVMILIFNGWICDSSNAGKLDGGKLVTDIGCVRGSSLYSHVYVLEEIKKIQWCKYCDINT